MDKVRLNNFILWCKNWYQPIDNRMDMIAEAQKILTLDGYLSCNNPISIALGYINELVDAGVIKRIRLQDWNADMIRHMTMFHVNYNEALLYRIRNFFAFECSKLSLTPPIYSRKIFKMGFVAPRCFGNSYTLANYKVKQYFNKNNIMK